MLKEWKRKSLTNTRSKKAKERLSEVEVHPWNEGGCAKTRNTGYESGEKIAGRDFFLVYLEHIPCSVCNASRRSQRKKQI